MDYQNFSSTPGEQEMPVKEKNLVITEKILFEYLYGKREIKAIELKENKRKIAKEPVMEYSKRMKTSSCEECCKYTDDISCPVHMCSRRSYALRSFPPEVQLCTSSIPGYEYGACAGQRIPRGTWIGPYEGKLVDSKTVDFFAPNTYIWEIYHKNGEFSHFLDGSDESCSSWMRFIRCARHKNEQNMAVFQFGENIYYRAIKDINIGEEILVWYDQSYSQFLGIPYIMSPQEKKVGGSDTDGEKHSTIQQFLPNTISKQLNIPEGLTIQKPPFQSQPAPYQIPPMLKQQQSPLQSPSSTVPSPLSTIPVVYKLPTKSSENTQNPREIEQQRPSLPYHYVGPIDQIKNMMVKETDPPLLQACAAPTMKLGNHQWSVGEVKENVPVKNVFHSNNEYQTKMLNNTHLTKQQPLQSLSTSVNSFMARSSPFPENRTEQDVVSSTVQTRDEVGASWKCGQCQKSFSQRLILQIHVCTGAPKKPYQCGRCPLSFSHPSKLREHVIIHNKERPFKCGFCGRSFAGATTLNNHMRMHTGERPFSCEKCGNSFVTATQLSRHLKQPSECRVIQTTELNRGTTQVVANS